MGRSIHLLLAGSIVASVAFAAAVGTSAASPEPSAPTSIVEGGLSAAFAELAPVEGGDDFRPASDPSVPDDGAPNPILRASAVTFNLGRAPEAADLVVNPDLGIDVLNGGSAEFGANQQTATVVMVETERPPTEGGNEVDNLSLAYSYPGQAVLEQSPFANDPLLGFGTVLDRGTAQGQEFSSFQQIVDGQWQPFEDPIPTFGFTVENPAQGFAPLGSTRYVTASVLFGPAARLAWISSHAGSAVAEALYFAIVELEPPAAFLDPSDVTSMEPLASSIVAGPVCQPGEVLDDGLCVPECDEGSVREGETCVPLECADGEVLEGGACVPADATESEPAASDDAGAPTRTPVADDSDTPADVVGSGEQAAPVEDETTPTGSGQQVVGDRAPAGLGDENDSDAARRYLWLLLTLGPLGVVAYLIWRRLRNERDGEIVPEDPPATRGAGSARGADRRVTGQLIDRGMRMVREFERGAAVVAFDDDWIAPTKGLEELLGVISQPHEESLDPMAWNRMFVNRHTGDIIGPSDEEYPALARRFIPESGEAVMSSADEGVVVGGGRGVPVDDEPTQDEPAEDEPPQDEPPQDEPPQDEPPQDEPAGDGSAGSEPTDGGPVEAGPSDDEPTEAEPAGDEPVGGEPMDGGSVEADPDAPSEPPVDPPPVPPVPPADPPPPTPPPTPTPTPPPTPPPTPTPPPVPPAGGTPVVPGTPPVATRCDWELHFLEPGGWNVLKSAAPGHQACCIYRVEVRTTVLEHERHLGIDDRGGDRLRSIDAFLSWSGLALTGRAGTRSSSDGRSHESIDTVVADDSIARIGRWIILDGERPDLAARVEHVEETSVRIALDPKCLNPVSSYDAAATSHAAIEANLECSNTDRTDGCAVRVAAGGEQFATISGDLALALDGRIDDLGEFAPGSSARHHDADIDPNDDGVVSTSRRRDASDDSTSNDRVWVSTVHSSVEVEAAQLVPALIERTTDVVTSAIGQEIRHVIEVDGEMASGCGPTGCGCATSDAHVCACAPKFSLILGATSKIVVDDDVFSIDRELDADPTATPPDEIGWVAGRLV